MEVHEFYPVVTCDNCGDLQDECECGEFSAFEADECEDCGMSEADGEHDAD